MQKFTILKLLLDKTYYLCKTISLNVIIAILVTEMHSRNNGPLLEHWRTVTHVHICEFIIARIARILPTQTPSQNLAKSQFLLCTHANV